MYEVAVSMIHGRFHGTTTGRGDTIEHALGEALGASPATRGYGPTNNRARRQIIGDLEREGMAAHGWADYAIATLPSGSLRRPQAL